MRVEMISVIYDDDGNEIREQDFAVVQTTDVQDPSLAIINEIAATYVDLTFIDVLIGNTPRKYRIKEIQSMRKMQK